MKASKQVATFVLDFSDIEDISGDESEESQISHHSIPPPPPPQEQVQSQLQIKREGVEMPQIAIENEEEAPQKRRIDIQDQYWQINFEDLDEQDQGPDLPSPEPIVIHKEVSPPPVPIEEPQYIEQYFEDQIEDIENVEDKQKQDKVREQNKKEFIALKEQKQLPEQKEIPYYNRITSTRQKFYNPKNSLLYLRLKGREDLYKKLELIQEAPKNPEKDDLLEGLDCINNLLLDLSSVKEKQQPLEKPIPLQIQKHRLNEKGEHHKERKAQKIQPADLEIIQKEKLEKIKVKEAKLAESAMKYQQQQEAALARQVRHEQLQQQKQLIKLLNQRQVYRITTKKLVSSGMALYRCCLKEKQRDFVQWLRFSEIALINKGEDEIFIFEKRLSDYFFMNVHKKNMTSVRISKNTVFDKVVIPYKEDENKEIQVLQTKKRGNKNWIDKEELKNEKEDRYRSREKKDRKQELEDEKSQERENKKQKERRRPQKCELQIQDEDQKKGRQSQRKKDQNKSTEKSQDQLETVIAKENAQLDYKKGKVRCLESDDENENDLLDADKIKIFKVNNERSKKVEKKEQKQQPEEPKTQQLDDNANQNQKKNKFHKFRQQAIVLSRLETNDKIKKLQQINEKRKEKRQKEYLQQQLLIEQQLEEKVSDLKDDKKIINNKAKQPLKEKNTQQNYNSSLERQSRKSEQQTQKKTDSTKSTQKNHNKNKSGSSKKNLPKMTTRSTRIHNTRSGGTSSVSRSIQRATEVEPGYISTKRVYENQKLNKRKRRIIEDEDFEASPENKKAQPSKQQKKK